MSEEGKQAALAIAERHMDRIKELEEALQDVIGWASGENQWHAEGLTCAVNHARYVLAKAGPR